MVEAELVVEAELMEAELEYGLYISCCSKCLK